MNFEITSRLVGRSREGWQKLIGGAGLTVEGEPERILLVYDGDEIIATGARDGCVLKYIAVADSHRGEDITSGILTELRRDAFADGHTHLFLYTKPENRYTFESLFFYPVTESGSILVMENVRNGLSDFLLALPERREGRVGAIVMNANPFTLGHRALAEQACAECDFVFIFVLSEDKSEFSAADRFEMVRRGVADLKNVTVLKTGPYLISSATFPTYFIKDRDNAARAACELDVKLFATEFASRLGVTHRYVGTEPTSHLTELYNKTLKSELPRYGISVVEMERIGASGAPISASTARAAIKKGDTGALVSLLPKTTLDYLQEKELI